MRKIALRAENLSKAYQLGEIGTGTISRDLERWWARIRGKEDPFLRIGEVNERAVKGNSSVVWSLKDLNFEIEQGDAVGIIGRNGAGKSTLLKILSRITSPSTGRIYGNGRVASLLEVGTGFNPELTGRENIYLNGTIMGMRKAEIRRHFDAIVDFAGVERYIDTPVKRYSSGMYVRLGFAVAAYLESEILIVDEVLAVGDAEFQKKCLNKMNNISKSEGRTVLFVSHNMGSIEALCNRVITLESGTIAFDSIDVSTTIQKYLSKHSENDLQVKWTNNDRHHYKNKYFLPHEFKIALIGETIFSGLANRNDKLTAVISGEVLEPDAALQIGIAVFDERGNNLFWSFNTDDYNHKQIPLQKGIHHLSVELPAQLLNEGVYTVTLGIALYQQFWLCEPGNDSPSLSFELYGNFTHSPYWSTKRPGITAPILKWTYKTENNGNS